jgi:hypothetical protein
VLDLTGQGIDATIAALKATTPQPLYLYQTFLSGKLGRWCFEGQADLIKIWQDGQGRVNALVGDVKSTRKDKVHHRLQVAIYVRLLQQALAQADLRAGDFSGTVVRRDPDGTLGDPESSALFDLDPYFSAIHQLAEAEDSALNRVDAAGCLQDLHYYLDQKCDGCLFNPICMVESDERQDVGLVPFLESADKRVLVQHGICTVPQLASLKTLPELKNDTDGPPPEKKLLPAPGKEKLVQTIAESWPTGPKLDRLVQRAARVTRRFGKEAALPSYSYFFDANRSFLPDPQKYPDLVKVFLDTQADYLEERVYLAGAQVTGPGGSVIVVKMTPTAPTEESEHKLLTEWVLGIFEAVFRVAKNPESVPLHLYMYNRHDQKALLEALRRHLDALASIPALYGLLTESPALTQSAISFLYDEVKERRNLSGTAPSLQSVASQLGFRWQDGENALYYRIFEPGVFDYLWRHENGRNVEAAARFYSNLPLEYAYAAWGLLKAEDFKGPQKGRITQFSRATVELIRNFQAKRLEALAYIENSFKFKNSHIVKEPLNLLELGARAINKPPFRRVLEEFLFVEHYARLQEALENFSQPVLKRVQQGRALLARCVEVYDTEYRDKTSQMARFRLDFGDNGLDTETLVIINKIKTGDFVVLNPLEKDGRPWDILRGRICLVNDVEGDSLILRMTEISAGKNQGKGPPFRYYHDSKLVPEIGQYYIVDEMVDDLNGDRFLEACRQAEYNPIYHLIAQPHTPERNQRANLPPALEQKAQEFLAQLVALEGDRAPTLPQREVIAGRLQERLFLVQGPPGTGKSHTLGWAVLSRIYAALSNGESCRVAVSCQTHNAVNIVLESIAAKLAHLQQLPGMSLFQNLRLFKVGDSDDVNSLPGIEILDPWEQRRSLNQILGSSATVIGGTPGGLFKLMKQKAGSRGSEAMWLEKPFDLAILDEASQMNLPQALLACAWLRETGQLIVVGDHRQMAPILAHSWSEDDRLTAVSNQPYRSVFQFLLDQQFPRVALDESFRLHRLHAEFLHEHIYKQDGIMFHSRRDYLLDGWEKSDTDPYLYAVLNPTYPIIVVEHAEKGSQQANPTEAELIAPVVEVCLGELGLDEADGIGVVVPHRAQKALLRDHFPHLAATGSIDTVERFQGGERDVIIVSATASDPDYVRAEAEFLLNPNRLNVALSRPRKKLVVVASTEVFKFLTPDLELFNNAVLWKRLLINCREDLLWEGNYAGTFVRVYGKKAI